MTSGEASAERLGQEDRGPALLFLHHFGGSARSWSGVIERLSERHRCIAPDLPGFGTNAAHPGPFTTEDSADYIIDLLGGLGLSRYHIVGHSMGGKIALAVAARGPRGLGGLVLLAPSPPSPEPLPDADRAHLLASWGDREAMAAVVRTTAVRPLSGGDRERQVADMLAASKQAWDAWLSHGSREDISASIEKIAVPITVVAGGCDQNITAAVLRQSLLQRAHAASLEIIPGVGHLLPLEARDQVAAIILRSVRDPQNVAKTEAKCTK